MTRDPAHALPVIRALSKAVYTRAIYPTEHPRVAEGAATVLGDLATAFRELRSDEVTFLVIENELLFDDRPLRSHTLQLAPFVRTMQRLGIDSLTLAAGLAEEECRSLIDSLAGFGEITSTPNARIGRVRLLEPGERVAEEPSAVQGTEVEVEATLEATFDEAQDSFVRLAADPVGSVEQLDRMLWRLIEGLDQTSRSLVLLAPMKSFDRRLFLHSINVALLTIAQARSLGIQDQALHDIGLAALFHDVGKLSLPHGLFDRSERLTDREWEIAKLHPELGAARLCGLPQVPHLAVLVAYEHHLRWDGRPSFPAPTTPRTPNLASQLTAIADTYDVMIAGRGLSSKAGAAFEVWRQRSDTYLDPFLVGNFVLMVSQTRTYIEDSLEEDPGAG